MWDKETVIMHTRKWVTDVVVGCNFCPFAAREVKRNSIGYEVLPDPIVSDVLVKLDACFKQLDKNKELETILLILPGSFEKFKDYLQVLQKSEDHLAAKGYEGIYQIASFHPNYLFAGSRADDAANYTNRSPYPMLHLLREESLTRVIDNHPDTNQIPERNIAYARQKGLAHMQSLLAACLLT